MTKREYLLIGIALAVMLYYFLSATPVMMDDGVKYEGFAESLAWGHLNFKSFYGFQGLSFFSVPVFWLTHSHNSIIIMSAIFSLFSVPLAYFVGKKFYQSSQAGIYFLILFLLMPYPYSTMMRGFQEAALLFFVLLIIWASANEKTWTPISWAIGGIVKPFALTLFPLFFKDFIPRFNLESRLNLGKLIWILVAFIIGGVAGAISTLAFALLQERQKKLLKAVDTCGVTNLHGIPGLFGGLIAIFVVPGLYAGDELIGIVITILTSSVLGMISGFIVSRFGKRTTVYEDAEEFHEG